MAPCRCGGPSCNRVAEANRSRVRWRLWYATATATDVEHGYTQTGVVHGVIEVLGDPTIDLAEIPAARWHRWVGADDPPLPPVGFPPAIAHTGLRAPFRFPDGTVADLVLTPTGWSHRTPANS